MDHEYEDVLRAMSDKLAAEITISLAWGAAQSYRHDSILRPFPSTYANLNDRDREKDIDGLRRDISGLPSVDDIIGNKGVVTSGSWKVLKWIFGEKYFKIRQVPLSQWSLLIDQVGGNVTRDRSPTHVFRVIYYEEKEEKFQALGTEFGKVLAFHGTKMENFYSIISNGFLRHMNKTSLFGEGTYLSSELSVAMTFSQAGPVWPKSSFHGPVTCLALCEVVDHPDVRCSLPGRSEPRGGHPVAGQVPEKYYVVSNNEHVLLRYIVMFERKSRAIELNAFLKKHWKLVKFALILFFLLLLIFWLLDDILRHLKRLSRIK